MDRRQIKQEMRTRIVPVGRESATRFFGWRYTSTISCEVGTCVIRVDGTNCIGVHLFFFLAYQLQVVLAKNIAAP